MKNRCRDCKYLIYGFYQTTQIEPSLVCELRPKKIYRADYNGVKGRQYHFSTKEHGYCNKFTPRKDDSE